MRAQAGDAILQVNHPRMGAVGYFVRVWAHLDYTGQVYITNDQPNDAADVAFEYDGRAEIEPLIAELNNRFGIGKVPSRDFIPIPAPAFATSSSNSVEPVTTEYRQ